jgi:hypothetical protein
MRQLDWKLIATECPNSWAMLYLNLETPNLTKSNILYHGKNGSAYNYRDLSDFFDSFSIEWTIETETNFSFQCNVADFHTDSYITKCEFTSRFEAEQFAILQAFYYLENRMKHIIN